MFIIETIIFFILFRETGFKNIYIYSSYSSIFKRRRNIKPFLFPPIIESPRLSVVVICQFIERSLAPSTEIF